MSRYQIETQLETILPVLLIIETVETNKAHK